MHKGHSETGTGTDDDGSEATNEREAGDHAAAYAGRRYEDELRLGDFDNHEKEQRIFPSRVSGRTGDDFETHPLKTASHASMHPISAAAARDGQGGPFECHGNDEGCSPFAFLEEGDTQHKRKISEVLDSRSEGSYHHHGNPEVNYASRNMVCKCIIFDCCGQLARTRVQSSECILSPCKTSSEECASFM